MFAFHSLLIFLFSLFLGRINTSTCTYFLDTTPDNIPTIISKHKILNHILTFPFSNSYGILCPYYIVYNIILEAQVGFFI